MITLIDSPKGRVLIRSKTKAQAIDFVTAGLVTAKPVGAEEVVDLLACGLEVIDIEKPEEKVSEQSTTPVVEGEASAQESDSHIGENNE